MITEKKVMKKVKKVVNRTKKKTLTRFYGLMHMRTALESVDDKSGDYSVYLDSCKSDHINHSINSFILNNSEEDLKDMVTVEVTIMGKPMVKTTREITIKK